jgi:hypothetical protein
MDCLELNSGPYSIGDKFASRWLIIPFHVTTVLEIPPVDSPGAAVKVAVAAGVA